MNPVPLPWMVAGVALLVIASSAIGYRTGYKIRDGQAAAEALQTTRESNEKLAASEAKRQVVEKEMADERDKAAKERADKETYINGLRLAHGRLFAAHGGLYDKNGRPVPGKQVPSDPAVAGEPAAALGCRLSGEVTGDLLDFAADASREASNYAACYAAYNAIRKASP